jgi:hypothetical protein
MPRTESPDTNILTAETRSSSRSESREIDIADEPEEVRKRRGVIVQGNVEIMKEWSSQPSCERFKLCHITRKSKVCQLREWNNVCGPHIEHWDKGGTVQHVQLKAMQARHALQMGEKRQAENGVGVQIEFNKARCGR